MYAIEDYELQFSADYATLSVLDADAEVVTSFDLTEDNPPYRIRVENDAYYIESESLSPSIEAFALDVDADAGEMSFTGARLGGLNIIDMRDTGQATGPMEIALDEGNIAILRTSSAYGLKVFVSTLDCIIEPS